MTERGVTAAEQPPINEADSPQTATADEDSSFSFRAQFEPIQRLLGKRRDLRWIALLIAIALFFLSLVVVWYCWFVLLPDLWNWGIRLNWQLIPAIIAIPFLAFLPIYAPIGAIALIVHIAKLYAQEADTALSVAVEKASEAQENAENFLLQQLGDKDSSGLVSAMRYSRVQLQSYYDIGLTQTQKSFRGSVVAMWLGFGIIALGILYQVFPFQQLGLPPASADLTLITLAGGAIVEVVSALFLWVYRSTIVQLTYFYNRQIYNHSVLMAYLIAQTMGESDETKKLIVEQMLSRDWAVTRSDMPGAKGLAGLIPKKG